MEQQISSYEQERYIKGQKLRELGIDPYGEKTDNILPLSQIKSQYKPEMGHDNGPFIKGSGRIILKRDMGKLSFITLRDESGDLQIALDKKRLSDLDWQVRNLIDLGDLLVVEGNLGTTQKGEITIWTTKLSLASKSLLPPPSKLEGLSDKELRYRQRYVDLWSNPDVMKQMKNRIMIVQEIRNFMTNRGFCEVETPMMVPLAGGASAKPFTTHHNSLDIPLYLRIAPELYLKRLLVGGFTKIFELNRNFRNEGISPKHNPEFTMIEAYEAFGSWTTMADLVENMICHLAQKNVGKLKIEHKNDVGEITKTIDLSTPWRRVKMVDLVEEKTGWKFDGRKIQDAFPELLDKVKHNVPNLTSYEQLVEVYEKLIEPTLINPCFVTHIPSVVMPLAKESKEFPGFAEVYELAINGQEISPGYSELNDPDVQFKHLSNQVGDKDEQQKMDYDFLTALKYGMPPAGGMGIGIDRLIMMLSGAESIKDVILFPLMKPNE